MKKGLILRSRASRGISKDCQSCGELAMTKSFRTLDDVDVKGKRVLLRVDLNVPMESGRVTDATRLERIAPTITEISDKGGKVILLAHFGRPKGRDAKESLKPVAAALSQVIKKPVGFADDCIGEAAAKAVGAMKDGDIALPGKHAFSQGRRKERSGLRRGAGQARRHLGQRRILGGAPRTRLHRGPRPQAAGLCRAHHAGRTRRARPRRWKRRPSPSSPSSAAQRSRPRSTCWKTSSARSTRW